MTMTFNMSKLTTIKKKFTLSTLSHNKANNKKIQLRYRCRLNYSECHPITTYFSLVIVRLRQ